MLPEPEPAAERRAKAGGLAGTRTLDQCLKRALLYQLSYQPTRVGQNSGFASRRKNFSPEFGWQNGFVLANLRHAVA